MANLVGPPNNGVKYYDPTEDRRQEPQGFNFRVPPPKYDDKGFSIRSGSRNRNLSYLQPDEDEDEPDVLKAQQDMFAQKVRGMSQKRVVPAFKTKHFGQRSKSIMKPDAYT